MDTILARYYPVDHYILRSEAINNTASRRQTVIGPTETRKLNEERTFRNSEGSYNAMSLLFLKLRFNKKDLYFPGGVTGCKTKRKRKET